MTPARRATRWRKPVYVGLGAVLALGAALELIVGFQLGWGLDIGLDFRIYLSAADRLVHGESWFLARQLAGPYDVKMGDVLYPVSAAWLFAPFLILPTFLWWAAVPIFIATIGSFRPAAWTWPLIAACCIFPYTLLRVVTGNPAMWLAAFEALGFRFGFPAAIVFLKPTMAPFTLTGARHRSWWVVAAILAVITLPGLVTYIRVVLDANIGSSWLYPFFDVPLMLIPIIAWLGRTGPAREASRRVPLDGLA